MSKKEYTLDEVKTMFKGKGGNNVESESILVDNGADKVEGFVTIWTNRSDASKIIDKCGSSIIKFEASETGVHLWIDRKAFRGMHGAFRKVGAASDKPKNNKKSEAAKERMKKYWADKKKES